MSLRKSTVEFLEARQLLSGSTGASTDVSITKVQFGDSHADTLTGQWIVQLGGYEGTAGSQLKKARRLLTEQDASVFVRQYLVADGLFSVRMPAGLTSQQQYDALSRLPGFVSAEPDWVQRINLTPNDPSFGSLTGLNQANDQDIDAPEAWNTTTGSMAQVVGIIDSGVNYNHPDLVQNIFLNQAEIPASRLANLTDVDGDGLITFRDLNNAVNQGVGKIQDLNSDGRISGFDVRATMNLTAGVDNGTGGWADGIDTDTNGFADDLVGWNFLSGNNDPNDVFGHGSHVAGTVGAVGNNGVGVVGVNWKVSLLPLKVGGINSSDNTISTSAATAALNYSVLMKQRGNQVRVTNNSWGGGGFNSALQSAIQSNSNNDILFVAAAGNDGTNNDSIPHYPSNYTIPNVISVANLLSSGNRSGGSNFGATTVDLGAPGTNILSTTGSGYSFFTGTSMASPHVAGVAALLLSAVPTLTVAQMRAAMFNTVDVIPSLAGFMVTGGRVNAFSALQSILLPAPGTPTLASGSDTGASSSDGITNDNTPTLEGTAPVGSTVKVFVDGNEVASVAAPAGTWSFTTGVLADGPHTVTASATSGAQSSIASAPLEFLIDTVAPTTGVGLFDSSQAPHRLNFPFSENLADTFSTSFVSLQNLITLAQIPSSNLTASYNPATNLGSYSFTGFAFGIVPSGNYRATVQPVDVAGNVQATPTQLSFQFLNGDATGDGTVNLNDFTRLAANFGQSPRIYSQGDFNYDTVVNLNDFTILAASFGLTLPPLADLPRGASVASASPGLFSNTPLDDSKGLALDVLDLSGGETI
ncbi:MAG TPA: S8 family serine peptidase [Tepidisphaeraceae bacterium]|nr:S8 family serine peptidase [Tepidisphaeraceae bacterium]